MRILHLLDHSLPLHSGYTFRTLAILRQQRALGWSTLQLTGARQGLCGAAQEGVDGWFFLRTPDTRRWAAWPVLRQVGVLQALSRRLEQVLEECRPDILHAHSPSLNGLAALAAGRRHGIPVVYEVRAFWEDAAADLGRGRQGGPRYRLSRALESHVLRQADAITTICAGLRGDMLARGIAGHKITVIPNAVDLDSMAPAAPDPALLHALDLTGGAGAPVLAFIGSFYAYEGLPLLLQAMPLLLASHPGLRLLLVGGGPEEAALRTLRDRLGLGESVTFCGRADHHRIADYYALADILVYPRLPMRLTELVTPLKPLEAMALERLVVASDVGGHRELIAHGKTGMLFEAGNGQALVETIRDLLRQRANWPALRGAARRLIETERNWRASAARYAGVYRDAQIARHARDAAQARAAGMPP
jgi:PEP-CTERM/exosortase A-associated glycosyltransferase